MEKWSELISALKSKGVDFEIGMDNKEIEKIEKIYKIRFPLDLKKFYGYGLPVSYSFVNWRDLSKENIEKNKLRIQAPIKGIKESLNDVDWDEVYWGKEPKDEKERNKKILDHLNQAPRLIPIYSHRYISELELTPNPVISIVGSDIIYYGETLFSYLQYEFKLKEKNIEYYKKKKNFIPFWSEIM
ncbi:hypothetical protein [Candidatus Enterococcus lemimoniae]|uniref:Knr4/Smi1-like domain-containing protein n=1 Tax=Candidatus Enterococcus lemimoniae TaxID=1834167 RepID=A0ABZ2T5S2_9ENTE